RLAVPLGDVLVMGHLFCLLAADAATSIYGQLSSAARSRPRAFCGRCAARREPPTRLGSATHARPLHGPRPAHGRAPPAPSKPLPHHVSAPFAVTMSWRTAARLLALQAPALPSLVRSVRPGRRHLGSPREGLPRGFSRTGTRVRRLGGVQCGESCEAHASLVRRTHFRQRLVMEWSVRGGRVPPAD